MSIISKDQLRHDEVVLFRFLVLFNAFLLISFFIIC